MSFIFDAVRDYAKTRANHAALIFGDRVTSYGDLELRANRVANGLSSFSLKPQNRIAILKGNNDSVRGISAVMEKYVNKGK